MSEDNNTRKDYIDTVVSIVEDILADLEIKTKEQYEAARSDVLDRVWESVDSSQWIIYTYLNGKVLEYSDNEDAYKSQGIELNTSEGFNSIRLQVAFYAMHQDVMEELDRAVEDLPEDTEALNVSQSEAVE